ncbi:MAG: hypothetical protein AAGJ83_01810, partial [Planctomycetota bacterium]
MIDLLIRRICRRFRSDEVIRRLIVGSPALVGMVIAFALLFRAEQLRPEQLAERYFRASIQAYQADDYETADRWLRKVLAIRPGDPAARFHRAMNAIANGSVRKASRIIAELAPEDGIVYGPAHLFVASQLIQLNGVNDRDVETRIRFHVQAALTQHPDDSNARHLAAEFELALHHVADAIQHYDVLAQHDPSFHRLIAGLHVVRGETALATRRVEHGFRAFQSIIQSDATHVRAQIELAKLHAFVQQYESATALLHRLATFQHIPTNETGEIQS